MRVFISHSSGDKPAVEVLARGLRERGVEAWLDKWVIGPGDDIVAKINEGLEQAGAGLIVFSAHPGESRWVEAEASYLTRAHPGGQGPDPGGRGGGRVRAAAVAAACPARDRRGRGYCRCLA